MILELEEIEDVNVMGGMIQGMRQSLDNIVYCTDLGIQKMGEGIMIEG